jgi:hypothetical protein
MTLVEMAGTGQAGLADDIVAWRVRRPAVLVRYRTTRVVGEQVEDVRVRGTPKTGAACAGPQRQDARNSLSQSSECPRATRAFGSGLVRHRNSVDPSRRMV